MLEVQQGHHQAGGQTRTTGVGKAFTGNYSYRTKLVQILDLLARCDLPGPALGQGSFDFLPRHAVGKHRQWVAEIDHLIQAVSEKVIGHGAAFKTPRKQALLNIYLRVLTIRNHPRSPAIMRAAGVFQGRPSKLI
jgi:hypothetical protein